MITVTTYKIENLRVIEVVGELLPGSAGIDEAVKIKSAMDELVTSKEPIVFDFTKLKYVWGNYIFGLFMSLILVKIEFNIIATGETKNALFSLIESAHINGIYKINIVANMAEALQQLNPN